MQQEARAQRVRLYGQEIDLLGTSWKDASGSGFSAGLQLLIQEASMVLLAPGVSTFSRARAHWRTSGGPRPLRSHQYVLGFPWLSGKERSTVEDANFLVLKTLEICSLRHELSKPFLFEHPEQLGAVNDFIPASVWDLDELKHLLLLEGVRTAAFFQCQWGAPSSKPTRFLWYLVPLLGAALHPGAPLLTSEGRYSGPLPASCGHRHARRLLGKSDDNCWRTSSAAYPLPMCRWLAQNMLRLCRVDGGVDASVSGHRSREVETDNSEDSDASVETEGVNAGFDISSLRLSPPTGPLPRVDGESDAEKFAAKLLKSGKVTREEFEALCGLLPTDPENRATSGELTSKTFISGLYQRGGIVGLHTHLHSHPWATALLCAILRAAFPGEPFTSVVVSRNRQVLPHRDSQNGSGSWNLLVPASRFTGGGIWQECGGGEESMEYEGEIHWGKTLPVAEGPQRLDPHRLHATMSWKGVRTVVIGFSIRAPGKASRQMKDAWKRVSGLRDAMQTDEAVTSSSGLPLQLLERKAGEEGDTFHGHLVQARQDNFGDPITVQWRGKVHSFVDGCGLNSPGRWRPTARGRGYPSEVDGFVASLRRLLDEFIRTEIGDPQRAYFMLALGKYEEAPFTEAAMNSLRVSWFKLLEDPASASYLEPGQPFFLEALSQTCRAMGDEDWEVLTRAEDNYARGRRLGVNRPFPRVVAVFRPKGKWREYDESEFQAVNENYASAKAVPEQLEKQFEEEEALGFMYPLSEKEARRRFGDTLRVASLGAIIKDDGSVRALFDGTHSVKLNNMIVIADRLEFPTPSNVARAMEVQQEDGHNLLIGIAADIAKAHRRFKHAPEDHGYLGCRARPDGPVWINRVGTFGVACAAYHFARLAGLVGRGALRVAQQAPLFQMLFADDLQIMAGGERKYHDIWVVLLYWLMVGTPFKWSKFRGGVCLDYVGFYFDYFRFNLGLSERRANWIMEFILDVQKGRGMIEHRRFTEFVGRLVYAGQVLYWLRPFMGPLHRWKAAIAPGTVALVPRMVMVVLRYILKLLQEKHHLVSCKSPPMVYREAFRTDAKAEDDYFVLGGWETIHSFDTKECRWFSVRVDSSAYPFLFNAQGTAKGMSTVAELLATWLGLHLFGWLDTPGQTFSVSAGTDNLANELVMRRQGTTKFPLTYVYMQLEYDLYRCGGHMNLNWRPRELNTESDDLTNGRFDGFSSSRRIDVKFSDVPCKLIHELASFHSEMLEWRKGGEGGTPMARLTKRQKIASKSKW